MNGFSFLELWNRFQAEQKAEAQLAEYRKLSTDELKKLWDSFYDYGNHYPSEGPDIEDVHLLLNERGEGKYCAV